MDAPEIQKGLDQELSLAAVMAVWAGDKPDQIITAINSVLQQTRHPDEFIVVIDGPVDDDVHNCFSHYIRNKQIVVHQLPKNLGRGPARNHAIGNAQSDVIAMMDADDVCRADRFEKQLTYLQSNNLDMLGGGIEEFDKVVGDLGELRITPLTDASIAKTLQFRSAFNHVTLMYRRAFFQDIGGYSDLNYVEDWDLYLRSVDAGAALGNIQDVVVDVRKAAWRRKSTLYFLEEVAVLTNAFKRGQFNVVVLFMSLLIRLVKLGAPIWLTTIVYKYFLRRKK